jgi:hypothetical protein
MPLHAFRNPVLAVLLILVAAPALAAEATFPVGSRIGLVPPPGMTASRTFQGFEDKERNAAIFMIEAPAQAFAEIDTATSSDAAAKFGIAVEKRESVTLKDGKAIIIRGRQEADGKRFRKWLLVAGAADLTAIITAQIPETEAKAYPDQAIRTALGSMTLRPPPIEERLGLLPFKLNELAGFRVVRVIPSAVVLTDGPSDEPDPKQPYFVVAVGAGGPAQAADRETFARQALATFPSIKDIRVTSAESFRIVGQPGFEIRAQAKDAKSEADVAVVQWIRFGTGGYLRAVGVTPKDDWAELFPRFRAIRDGVDPR